MTWSGQPLLHVARGSLMPPLPTSVSTIALWHSELTISGSPLETWLDAVNSASMAQATTARRPLVAADGSHFNGRPVVQTNVADQRYLSTGVVGSPFWNAGARPWAFSVMRLRTPSPAGHSRCYQTGDGASGGVYDLSIVSSVNLAIAQVGNANNVVADVLAAPHLFGAGINPAGQSELVVDGVSAGTLGTGLGAAQCSLISIGAFIGPSQYNDLSMGMLWFLSGRPSAPEEAAILAWSRAYYGTP